MTFEVILEYMNTLCLHNVSIHRNFEPNQFINECARKKKPKMPKSQNHGVPEFLVRYRKTYVLKNLKRKIIPQAGKLLK